MRNSGWILPGVALAMWLACILWPVIAFVTTSLADESSAVVIAKPWYSLLITSMGWSIAVALGAVVVGWAPGRVLGQRLAGQGFVPYAALMLVPICLPSYIVYYAWWQSWPADSEFYRWIVTNNFMQTARHATLYAGLVCWSWPLVSWAVAWGSSSRPAHRDESLKLDHASALTNSIDRFRTDLPGVAIGAMLVFMVTLANTTSFDLAEVFTFANELRAIEALRATPRVMLSAAWPQLAICAIGAIGAWQLVGGRRHEASVRSGQVSQLAVAITLLTWVATVVLPLSLFARTILTTDGAWKSIREFGAAYQYAFVNTFASAAFSGICAALIGAGLFMAWQDHRKLVRALAWISSITWLFAAVIPGSILGVSLESAYHRAPFAGAIYSNAVILTIGHLACFGFVPALLARWCALRQPRGFADMQQLDGGFTLPGALESARPQMAFIAVTSFAIVLVFSLAEIPVTAIIAPPARVGSGPLALTLLNDMHYQRPQSVMVAAFGMVLAATIVAFLVALAWRILRSISGMGPAA
jgi:hypothetical protein